MSHRTNAYLYLLIVSIIWGAAAPVVKFTLRWLDPWTFLLYRMIISSVIALIYFRLAKVKIPRRPADLSLVAICDFFSTPLAIGLFFLALSKTSALTGSLLTAGAPLLLVVSGVIFFHDRLTNQEKLGIGIAFLGIVLIAFWPYLFGRQSVDGGVVSGNMLMIGATIADIIGAVLAKLALKRKISPAFLGQSQFILGLLFFLPIALIIKTPYEIFQAIFHAPLPAHLGVWFMALFSGTIAYTIRNLAAKTIEISEVALFNYLQPLWAVMLTVIWLGESISTVNLLGTGVIVAGIIIAETKRQLMSNK